MFADFRIANSQGTAVSRTADRETHNHTVKDHPSRTRQSPTSTIIAAEKWLAGPEKNTDSADGTGPAFSRDT